MYLFAAAVLAVGCGPSSEIQRLNEEGLREYEAGYYVEAIAMFKNAAELDRERPEASFYKGRCEVALAEERFREGNLLGALNYCDRAAASFDAAIAAFPGYSRAVQGKADALRLRGKHQAAVDLAEWAAKNSGGQATMLILKGREYAQSGDMDRAELTFKQATAVEPNNAVAFAELGLFHMRLGNNAAAAENLRKAQEINPGIPGVAAALAQLNAR